MNNTLKASRLLIALLSPFVTISTAQADSLDEWAYWNATPQFAPENFQHSYTSSPDPTTAEQTRTGTNNGELAEATGVAAAPVETGWVGYSLVGRGEGSNQLGDVSLLPVNEVGTENDSLFYKDSGPFSILLNLAGEGGEKAKLDFPSGDGGDGNFNVTVRDPGPSLTLSIGEGGGTSNDPGQDFISDVNVDVYSASGYEGGYLGGVSVVGKLMPVSNIAAAVTAASGNLLYSFSGRSGLQSPVKIDVNFTQATWVGKFGVSQGSTRHSGYAAVGSISGNTLNSTSITGNAAPAVGDSYYNPAGTVLSGTVTGRLVGELGVGDIGTAGIIGKSTLTVQPFEGVLPLPPGGMEGGMELAGILVEAAPASLARTAVVKESAAPVTVNDVFMLGAAPVPR